MGKLNKRQTQCLHAALTLLQAALHDDMAIEILLTEQTCEVTLLDPVGAPVLQTSVADVPTDQVLQVLEALDEEPVYDA